MKSNPIRCTMLSLLVLVAALAAAFASPASAAVAPEPPLNAVGTGPSSLAERLVPPLGHSLAPGRPDSRSAPENRSDTIPGSYIVVFEDSVQRPGKVARAQAAQRDGELGFVYPRLNGYSVENLSRGDAEALRDDPRVKHVSPDREVAVAAQEVPTGIGRIYATQNEVADIDGEDARVDVDVAVIDTGVRYNHTDLNVVGRADCVPFGEDPEEDPFEGCKNGGIDHNGHGTHVAGTIGALDDGAGVVGVAPGARLWAVRALNKNGSGSFAWVIGAVEWVTATRQDEDPENDIEVANMSIGCGLPCVVPAFDEALSESAKAGVVYAVAAGNNGGDAGESTFGTNPDVITVSALADYDGKPGGESAPTCQNYGADDTLASFSNYGEDVEVAAPGVCIYSTSHLGGYATKSGTSMASPHVAGAAALRASQDPPEDLEDVEEIRAEIEADGNLEWTDDSPDEAQEPLLDVGRVITEPAEIESESEVTLRGRVRPGGVQASYRFEYGESAQYGASVPVPDEDIGSGSQYVDLSESLEGLEGQTTYHYRIVAVYDGEETVHGEDRTFVTTPPTATTAEASEIHGNDAVLNATVNPQGGQTDYWFEYGPTGGYGFKSPALPDDAGSGVKAVEVSEAVGGLVAEETYHFRIVAENTAGIVYGEDEVLSTLPPEWTAHLPEATEEAESLAAISCISEDDCVLLGNPPSYDYGLTWRLHDEEWSALPDIPEVEGADFTQPVDLSCTSITWCVATGFTSTGGGGFQPGEWQPLAATWDGVEWQQTSVPLPPTAEEGRIEGVSCTSATFCMAVGWNIDDTEPLAWRWDGEEWSDMLPKLPLTADFGQLVSVSCTSSSHCVAAGYTGNGTGWSVLVVSWDGNEWTTEHSFRPNNSKYPSAESVSCSSPDACMVVGGYNEGLFADRWDGEEWTWHSESPLPSPGGGELNSFNPSVSCSSSSFCAVVADASGDAPSNHWPVASVWDGNGWTRQSTGTPLVDNPWTPPVEEEYSTFSSLFGVECTSSSMCIGTGVATSNAMLEVYSPPAPPTAITEAASQLTQTAATLNAIVNPRNDETTYQFEYVDQAEFEESGYENATAAPASPKTLGSAGIWKVAVSDAIEGLEPSTTHRFRVVATNEQGTTYGEDETFTTAAEPYFDAESHPVTIAGEQAEKLKLSFPLGYVSCEETEFEGEASAPGPSLSLAAELSKCLAGGKAATIDMNSCHFDLGLLNAGPPYEGNIGVGCTQEGDGIVIAFEGFSGGQCTITYKAQGGKEEGVSLENLGSGSNREIEASFDKAPLKAKSTGTVINCGAGNGTEYNSLLSGALALEGANGKGQVGVFVSIVSFSPPQATTGAAADITAESATLHGTANPNGLETTYQFQYVDQAEFEENGYENATAVPASPKGIGSGTESVDVEEALEGLEPETTYHFRVVATNSAGTDYGEDEEFTAAATGPRFDAESHPVSISGSQSETDYLKFWFPLGNVHCEEASLEGEASAPGPSLELAAELSECVAIGNPATISMNSCHFELGVLDVGPPYEGNLGVGCTEEGDGIVIEFEGLQGNPCTLTYAAQDGGEEGVSLENAGEGSQREIEAGFDKAPLKGRWDKATLFNCGAPKGAEYNHPLSGAIALEGSDGEGQVGVFVSGGE